MTRRRGAVLITLALGAGCRSNDVPPARPSPPVASPHPDPAPPATDAPPLDAAMPDAPPVAVTVGFEQLLLAGPRPEADVRARLDGARDRLADCARTAATSSLALELGFAIAATGEIPHVRAYGATSPELTRCIAAALGSLGRRVASDDEPTDGYVVVTLDRDGEAVAARPVPPSLRDDVRNGYCELHEVSGAKDLPVDQKADAMKAWFTANIRHPVAIHLAWQIWAAPLGGRAALLEQAARKAGIKTCKP